MPPTPPHAHPSNPYLRLLRTPGALPFTLGNLLARLPMGMFSVSAVLMISGSRGSYALAGAVTATGLAATALVAPWTARLVDRHGQARVAVPATAIAVAGSLALLLCVRLRAPDWTLFAAYAATATTPNTGGMSRARWAHLFGGPSPADAAALHTANSFEQAADELCFMVGPVAAAFLCSALFPEAGTLVGAVLLMTGVLIFAAQRATEPPAAPRTKASKSPLRARGFVPLLAVFLATGAVFGALEITTIAYADALGHRAAAGAVLALQAAGSCAAGLAYGALPPARRAAGRLGPVRRILSGTGGRAVREPTRSAGQTLVVCVAAMSALMCLPLLAARAGGSLPVLAAALLCAGAATAPTMVTGMTLIQRRTPRGRLNEGMTLAVTAILGGIALGSAAGGQVIGQAGAVMGYLVPVCAAAVALVVCVAGHGRYSAPPRR
ncbi:MFS transporter [Streptomyces sp. NPDC006704]|uniref:MFS transporter n=1 Tax=Streptomyces sp. NPDC006704 TaxID=3364760 RepID=UPI0036B3A3B3